MIYYKLTQLAEKLDLTLFTNGNTRPLNNAPLSRGYDISSNQSWEATSE